MIFRAVIVAAGLLLFQNVSVWACDQPDCLTAPRVKHLQIRQFMREQAASTRGVVLQKAPARHAANAQVSKRLHSPARVTTRYRYSRHSAKGALVKRTAHHPANSPAQPVQAASFAAQEPLVDVVTTERLDMVDGSAPASTARVLLQVRGSSLQRLSTLSTATKWLRSDRTSRMTQPRLTKMATLQFSSGCGQR